MRRASPAPLEPVDELGGVDAEALGQSEKTGETQVALPALDRRHKGEVESDALGQSHLAQAEGFAVRSRPRPELDLRGVLLGGASHAPQVEKQHTVWG